MKTMKKKRFGAATIVGALAILFMLAFVAYGISSAASAMDDAGLTTAEESIRRAAVSCYAIEGVYPPDYAYLKAHYGVRVDETRYTIIYEVFASNMMPDITVIKIR